MVDMFYTAKYLLHFITSLHFTLLYFKGLLRHFEARPSITMTSPRESSRDQHTPLRRSTRSIVVKNRDLSLYAEDSDIDDKENSQKTLPRDGNEILGNDKGDSNEKSAKQCKKRALEGNADSSFREEAADITAPKKKTHRNPSLALCIKKFGAESHDLAYEK